MMTRLIIEADLSSEELEVLISEITILHRDVFKKPLVLQQIDCSTQLPPSAQKCNDCGKEDETVKKRSNGYGLQCYECYKSDMDFEDEYR